MEELNFLEGIQKFADSDAILKEGRDVNELRAKFDDYILEAERKIQVQELEEKENSEEVDSSVLKKQTEELVQLKDGFYEIYTVYKEKKKLLVDAKNNSESENLSKKTALIKRLQEVVTTEENIGSAFGSLKEIQESWKEIGDIPRDKRNDIQSEFSRLIEDFFYNIKIYKDLKDHDFHRNAQLKTALIEELKKLNEMKSIKEVETQLKKLQNDWNDIGPVPNEQWETLKEGYWTEVRSVYNKVNRFYDDRRVKMLENLEVKKALLEEVIILSAKREDLKGAKEWDAVTKDVLAIQAKWKTVGFGPKKENDAIWKKFRAQCDDFFNAKKEFFGEIQEVYNALAEKKKALIEKVKALKNSTEWKDTAAKLKQFQSQWKLIGHSGVKHEQKLWKEFRGACDAFFNSRQNHFDEKDTQNEANLVLKQAVLAKIEKYTPSEDKKVVIAELKELSKAFNAIGHVPIKQKDEIFTAYKKLMDAHYKSIKLEAAEQEQILFEAKIDLLKGNSNSLKHFDDLKFDLRKSIDQHNKEITQLENNLGFFANSKGADSLKKGVEDKVRVIKQKVETIKQQLKMIPNE